MTMIMRVLEQVDIVPRGALEDALGLAALAVLIVGILSLPGLV